MDATFAKFSVRYALAQDEAATNPINTLEFHLLCVFDSCKGSPELKLKQRCVDLKRRESFLATNWLTSLATTAERAECTDACFEAETRAPPIQIFMRPSSAPAFVCRSSSGPAPDDLFRKTLTEESLGKAFIRRQRIRDALINCLII